MSIGSRLSSILSSVASDVVASQTRIGNAIGSALIVIMLVFIRSIYLIWEICYTPISKVISWYNSIKL